MLPFPSRLSMVFETLHCYCSYIALSIYIKFDGYDPISKSQSIKKMILHLVYKSVSSYPARIKLCMVGKCLREITDAILDSVKT